MRVVQFFTARLKLVCVNMGRSQTLLRIIKFMRSHNESKIVKYDSLQMFSTKIHLLFQVKIVVFKYMFKNLPNPCG
jgi:hypothetical protein